MKLTVIQILRQSRPGPAGPDAAHEDAAQLLAYCILGRNQFIASNSTDAADRAQHRLEAAIAAGEWVDARILLLAFHSGVLAPEIADRFDVEAY